MPLYLSLLAHCSAFFFFDGSFTPKSFHFTCVDHDRYYCHTSFGTFSRIETCSWGDLEHAISQLPEHALEILLDLAACKTIGNSAETFQETLHSLTKDDITTLITRAFPPHTFTAQQKKSHHSLDEACSALPSMMQAVITETTHSKKRKREHFFY